MLIKHFAKHIKNYVKYLLFQGEIFHRKSLVTLTRRNTVCRPLFNRYLITATAPPPTPFFTNSPRSSDGAPPPHGRNQKFGSKI